MPVLGVVPHLMGVRGNEDPAVREHGRDFFKSRAHVIDKLCVALDFDLLLGVALGNLGRVNV